MPAASFTAFPGKWISTDPLIRPSSDSKHSVVAVKDPSVLFWKGEWRVFATIATEEGRWSMVYTHFSDWKAANRAPWFYFDQIPGFPGYMAAPQVFWYAPQKLWYLVFQSGPPMYSTTDNIDDPTSWSVPRPFFAGTPAIIDANGGWLDFWVIGDGRSCYLFASDDHGRLYASKTSAAEFPQGFSDPTIVLEDKEAGRIFEASNVYRLKGTDTWLLLVEAFDSTSSWRRYFRSWTAPSIEGPWTPLHSTGRRPFAGAANVGFEDQPWTKDISHGEFLRDSVDETMTIDPASSRYLYQGFDSNADTSNYVAIPWCLGILEPRGQ